MSGSNTGGLLASSLQQNFASYIFSGLIPTQISTLPVRVLRYWFFYIIMGEKGRQIRTLLDRFLIVSTNDLPKSPDNNLDI